MQALHEKLALAATKSVVNYGFYIGATPSNAEALAAAKRTPGIKIFIGSSTGDLLVGPAGGPSNGSLLKRTLPICAHCEDEATIAENKARPG